MASGPAKIFHLAIPSKDLKEQQEFYKSFGCRVCRIYDDHITLDLFGNQLVCHLAPDKIDQDPQVYPRHFGITFKDSDEFENLASFIKAKKIAFFKEPFTRFEGKREEHRSFMILDPSNNIIEFKWYNDPEMMF